MKTWGDLHIDVPPGAHGEIDTTCPECSSQRKKKKVRCLSVNVDKGTFICHHCGWSGGLREGAFKADVTHWNKPRYRQPENRPDSGLSDKAFNWFKLRGITPEVLERNIVSSISVYMPQVEEHVSAIQFPYCRDGILVNVKYRDGAKNFRMEAGAERVLYGLDDIEDDLLVIVEGEIDKLSVEVAGIKSCVSVPDGAPPSNTKDYSSKFDFLESAQDVLQPVKRIILAVDKDEPGRRLQEELARRLGPERCYLVQWPEYCKDANDALVRHGEAALRAYILEATPYPVAGIFEVRDIAQRIDHLYEHGFERGARTGWLSVDNLYTVRPGEWTLVTGVPGHGKSNWLDHLLVNLAELHGWNFGVFSPENQPIERHAGRLMGKWVNAPFDDGPTHRMSPGQKDRAKTWLQNHFSWILPGDDADWSVHNVLALAKTLVYRRGIRGLVIDPWNELDHSRPHNLTETEYISKALTTVRKFARLHGVHVWLVAHPTKLRRDSDGKYPIPNPYDVSGSAHWRNKADNCITVFRDTDNPNNPVEIHVQKVRFDEVGRTGRADLQYDKPTGRYEEVESSTTFRRSR